MSSPTNTQQHDSQLWEQSPEVVATFHAHYDTPRGRIRTLLVADQISLALEGIPARVLDVGAGDLSQAIEIARRGSEVIAAEPSELMRSRGRDRLAALGSDEIADRITLVPGSIEDVTLASPYGPFDLVSCHGVLMYLPDSSDAVANLARNVKPGNYLSIVTKNATGLALRPGVMGLYSEAKDSLRAKTTRGWLGVPTRGDTFAELETLLSKEGLRTIASFGVGTFSDFVSEPHMVEEEFSELYRLDLEAGKMSPYREVSRLLHVVAVRD